MAAAAVGNDVGHEGTEVDVAFVAGHVDGILSRLRGPITDVTGAVVLVLALDLRLRRTLDRKTYTTEWTSEKKTSNKD